MNLGIINNYIPGTRLLKRDMGNATGMEFLNNIFYITDGIMLQQIREISGIDGSTLQNWVKRGWIANSVNKRYNKDQLARILIINMLRDTVPLEKINYLLRYINGNINDDEDNIISEGMLYDYICRITDTIVENKELSNDKLRNIIQEVTSDYEENMSGARKRLDRALEIIIISYYAALIKEHSKALFEKL